MSDPLSPDFRNSDDPLFTKNALANFTDNGKNIEKWQDVPKQLFIGFPSAGNQPVQAKWNDHVNDKEEQDQKGKAGELGDHVLTAEDMSAQVGLDSISENL